MTKRGALSVSLKILGLVAVLRSLLYVLMILLSMIEHRGTKGVPEFDVWIAMAFAIPVVLIGAGIVALKWGDWIATRLVKEDAQLLAIGSEGWQRPLFVLALKVVGAVNCVNGLAHVVRTLARGVAVRSLPRLMSPYDWGYFASGVALIVLGVYLLTGGRKVVEFAFKERRHPKEEP